MFYKSKYEASKIIAKIFEYMKWTWLDEKKPPSYSDILHTFSGLKKSFEKDDEGVTCNSSQTGRLIIERIRDTNEILYGLEPKSEDEYLETCEVTGKGINGET